MRILLLGLPRCGTTSLFDFIRELLPKNYKIEYEPYNKERDVDICENYFNKTVISNTIVLNKNETIYEWYNQIQQKFDKIIYIKRKDINAQKLSFAKTLIQKNKNWEKSLSLSDRLIDEYIVIFDKITENKKVYFYEDVYKECISNELYEISDFLNLNKEKIDTYHKKWIHTKNRDNFKYKITLI